MSYLPDSNRLRFELNARGLNSEQFVERAGLEGVKLSRPTVDRALRGFRIRESSAWSIREALRRIPRNRELAEMAAQAS